MIRENAGYLVAVLLVGPVLSSQAVAQEAVATKPEARKSQLETGFLHPPAAARPRVWWHWMNGNVTKSGVRKDLEWMKRIGIGGFQNFDANMTTPQVVENRLVYMEPDWQDALRYTAGLAQELGLEMVIAASPGWSETGGPWVPPEDGLKKLVWSQTTLAGGRRFDGVLSRPPSVTGPFQTLPLNDHLAAISGDKPKTPPTRYADVAVLAYPVAGLLAQQKPGLLGPDGSEIDSSPLTDSDLEGGIELQRGTVEAPPTLTFVYVRPQTVRSATFFAPGMKTLFTGPALDSRLEASNDGITWKEIAHVSAAEVPTTISFAPVRASRFRIRLIPQKATPPQLGMPAPGADLALADIAWGTAEKPLRVTHFELFGEPKVSQFERKAGFAFVSDYYALEGIDSATTGADPSKVIDLTSRMRPDGRLDWTPPPGTWRVVRLGWSLLGTTNHPATPEATGLEVDKFDAAAVRRYMEHYLDLYKKAVGPDAMGARNITGIQTDSIEVGATNWTSTMLEHFRRLPGYDRASYLPALTGGLIGSRTQSDRFLYDYRRTLADLRISVPDGIPQRQRPGHGLLRVHHTTLGNVPAATT